MTTYSYTRTSHAIVAMVLATACNNSSTPSTDSGVSSDATTHDAATANDAATEHDAGTDASTARSATVVDCGSVTPAHDIAWALGSSSNVQVSVSAGDVVQWHLGDALPHTVTSGTVPTPDGLFSVPLDSAHPGPVCVRFDTAGAYPFFCEIHLTLMTGTVTVQ